MGNRTINAPPAMQDITSPKRPEAFIAASVMIVSARESIQITI